MLLKPTLTKISFNVLIQLKSFFVIIKYNQAHTNYVKSVWYKFLGRACKKTLEKADDHWWSK